MSDLPDDAIELAHQLFDMAREGRADELGVYLDAGAPVDLTDPSGNTLLMLAAYHGQPETVRMLLDAGAGKDWHYREAETGLTLEQLADYATFRALTRTLPERPEAREASILALFDGAAPDSVADFFDYRFRRRVVFVISKVLFAR